MRDPRADWVVVGFLFCCAGFPAFGVSPSPTTSPAAHVTATPTPASPARPRALKPEDFAVLRDVDEPNTLFLCGENDFNGPLLNTEQMYQALRSLGVPTELVIYPGQNHGLKKPSYLIDRCQRYLDWYAKWITPAKAAAP